MNAHGGFLIRSTLRKVPEVTVYFWIVKVLTTGMGEATSDFAVHTIDPVVAAAFGLAGFVAALTWQLAVRRYIASVYWLAVTLVAVFGTMAADAIHIAGRVSYALSAAGFALVLIIVFVLWYAVERTLSIHSINTLRRELFYWAAVLATFAMGTAVGDLTAYTFHLGFLASALLFTCIIAVPAVLHRWAHLNSVFAFWFAYVITRPLGASYADWMGVPHSLGGLNWGRGTVSVALTIAIALFVIFLQISNVDVADGEATARVTQ